VTRLSTFPLALALALAILPAAATPIVGAGSFTAFGSNPNNNGSPFWDNRSSDGVNCNAGFFLAGSFGGCGSLKNGTPSSGLNLGAANLEYYSASNLLTPFTLAAGTYTFRLEGRIAGSNTFQIGYNAGSGNVNFFSNLNSVGSTFTLESADPLHLFIRDGSNFFSSTDAMAPGAAAFRNVNTGVYYFGFEDRLGGDRDYNDVLISATYRAPSSIPEPSTLALVGIAVAAGVTWRRFRRL
jgi:hypothetical protein